MQTRLPWTAMLSGRVPPEGTTPPGTRLSEPTQLTRSTVVRVGLVGIQEHGFVGERVHGHAGLVPGYVQAGHSDPAVFGDARTPRSNRAWCRAHSASALAISSGPCWLCQRTWAASMPTG